VRDGAAHLGGCVTSLATQTDGDFKVIAVNDGSRDRTPEMLRAWAAGDRRVRVLTQSRLGLVAAQRALLEAEAALAICGCHVRYVPRAGLKGGALRYERWLDGLTTPAALARDLFVECPLAHPTFFMRADAVAAVGGYRERGWPEDYDLVLRLWRAGSGLGVVPRVLLDWRERPDRLSRTHSAYSADAFRRCKAHHLARSLLRGRDGVVVWGAGPVGKAFGRAIATEGVGVRAFVDLDPRKIGQEIGGAPVIPPQGVADYRGAFCVAAVGQPGARAEIRAALAELGWEEEKDFVAVA